MARIVLVGSLLLSVLLALFLPARYPAERFMGHLRTEYRLAAECWGEAVAMRMLDRTLTGLDGAQVSTHHGDPALAAPTGHAIALVGDRLFRSAYATALESLAALAMFRLLSLWEWLPWLVPLGMALATDGGTVRVVRSREFVQHDPERFALFMSVAAGLTGGLLAGALLPVTLHPMLAPAVVVTWFFALSRALASFHRAG